MYCSAALRNESYGCSLFADGSGYGDFDMAVHSKRRHQNVGMDRLLTDGMPVWFITPYYIYSGVRFRDDGIKFHTLTWVFVFDDWMSKQNFWKQFISGVFIVIVMTGLDQDMMQKNLTCKTLRGAQKDMCTYGIAFLPANLLFLSLGVLLVLLAQQQGRVLPTAGDELLPQFVTLTADTSPLISILFTLGIVAASFSSADSALTSLTTIFCVDIKGRAGDEALRKRVHVAVCIVFVLFILLFRSVNSTSLIDAIYMMVSYTYGPLLGLFAFGLLTRRTVDDLWVPYIAVASPVLCFLLEWGVGEMTGYHFGYELLMLNGMLTFCGLWLISHPSISRSIP